MSFFKSVSDTLSGLWYGQPQQQQPTESERRNANYQKLANETNFRQEEIIQALDHAGNDLRGAIEFLRARLIEKRERQKIRKELRRQAEREDKRKKVTSKSHKSVHRRAKGENRKYARYNADMPAHLDLQKRKAARKCSPYGTNSRPSSQHAHARDQYESEEEYFMEPTQSYQDAEMNSEDVEFSGEEAEGETEIRQAAYAYTPVHPSSNSATCLQQTASRPSSSKNNKQALKSAQKRKVFNLLSQIIKNAPETRRHLWKDVIRVQTSRDVAANLVRLSDNYRTGDAAKLVALLQQKPELLELASSVLGQKAI